MVDLIKSESWQGGLTSWDGGALTKQGLPKNPLVQGSREGNMK